MPNISKEQIEQALSALKSEWFVGTGVVIDMLHGLLSQPELDRLTKLAEVMPSNDPLIVWAVSGKDGFTLFKTLEDAQRYIGQFSTSIGGGLHISEITVFGNIMTTSEKPKWHKGAPPSIGWWPASTSKDKNRIRWWSGSEWSDFAEPSCTAIEAAWHAEIKHHEVREIEWTERWWL